MLSDHVEKGNNLILMSLTPVATLSTMSCTMSVVGIATYFQGISIVCKFTFII